MWIIKVRSHSLLFIVSIKVVLRHRCDFLLSSLLCSLRSLLPCFSMYLLQLMNTTRASVNGIATTLLLCIAQPVPSIVRNAVNCSEMSVVAFIYNHFLLVLIVYPVYDSSLAVCRECRMPDSLSAAIECDLSYRAALL